MTNIKNNIEEILETGYEILFELEKEKLDFSKVKKLYDDRSESIDKLEELPKVNISEVSEGEREPLKNLFTRLQLLEKKLNRNLSSLSAEKKEDLKELSLHKKAKSLYAQNRVNRRKIVDLKSNS
jgi:hypothetical protein